MHSQDIDFRRDARHFTNTKTRTFEIPAVVGPVSYPLMARASLLSFNFTILIVSVTLTSSIEVSATNALGISVGINQGDVMLDISKASDMWITHIHDVLTAPSVVCVSSTKEFRYPFLPRLDSSNALAGYVTRCGPGIGTTLGYASVTYIPLIEE